MLVLARRLNESIIIAEEVRVTVLKIAPNRIELGVDAAPHISVDREEVHLRKHTAVMATRDKRMVRRLSVAQSRFKWK